MSDSDEDWEGIAKTAAKIGDGAIKGGKSYHATQGHKYKIKFDASDSCKVNVMDKTLPSAQATKAARLAKEAAEASTAAKAAKLAKAAEKAAKAAEASGPSIGDWAFRLDKGHGGNHPNAGSNHININTVASGLEHDPHIPLPQGTLTAGKNVAKFCKVANKVNKVAVPVAIAVDAFRTGMAIGEDVDNGTSRNTVETVASVAGGWGGGYTGAVGGAAIGSAICPVVGTIVGGILGGLAGGIGGSMGASAATEAIGDACDYNMEERTCRNCKRKFKVRLYHGEKYMDRCANCRR